MLLSVDDNGPGMPPELAEHIFERGITTKGDGHGTGLFLVSRIVEAYHGEVRVESTQGVGSSFILSFRAPQADTDTGEKLKEQIADLEDLLTAYREGWIAERGN